MSEDILNYYGTSMQIRVGDKIMYPKWFKKVPGTVVYVPGQSPVNKSMEYDDVKQWGIKLDCEPNDIIMLGYFPPDDGSYRLLVWSLILFQPSVANLYLVTLQWCGQRHPLLF